MSDVSASGSNDNPSPRPHLWQPHALPEGKNADGRSVWEPPILDYSDLIDDVFDKKREAVMKYLKGDVVKTTEVMDKLIERELMDRYCDWSEDNRDATVDPECQKFFGGLWEEVLDDWLEDSSVFRELDIRIFQEVDGTWVAMNEKEMIDQEEEGWWRENHGQPNPPPPQSEAESPLPAPSKSDSDIINNEDENAETSSQHTCSSVNHVDNDEPKLPSQATTARSRLSQQPEAPPTRIRSLSPNWRLPPAALAVPPTRAMVSTRRQPLALRLVALKISKDGNANASLQAGSGHEEEDVD